LIYAGQLILLIKRNAGCVDVLGVRLGRRRQNYKEFESTRSLAMGLNVTLLLSNPILFCTSIVTKYDRLRGLVIRVPGYRARGPVFDSQRCTIF
jgi:hypothetical protein